MGKRRELHFHSLLGSCHRGWDIYTKRTCEENNSGEMNRWGQLNLLRMKARVYIPGSKLNVFGPTIGYAMDFLIDGANEEGYPGHCTSSEPILNKDKSVSRDSNAGG